MRTVFDAHAVLRACVGELDPHQVKAATQAQLRGGHRGSSMSDGRGSGESPLPGSAGLTDDRYPDLLDETDRDALATLEAFEKAVNQLADQAVALLCSQRDIVSAPLRPVSKFEVRSQLDLPDEKSTEPLKWCLSCSRVKLDSGGVHHSLVSTAKRDGKDCVLCSWCADWQRNYKAWPPLELVQKRASGKVRLTTKDLREAGVKSA